MARMSGVWLETMGKFLVNTEVRLSDLKRTSEDEAGLDDAKPVSVECIMRLAP